VGYFSSQVVNKIAEQRIEGRLRDEMKNIDMGSLRKERVAAEPPSKFQLIMKHKAFQSQWPEMDKQPENVFKRRSQSEMGPIPFTATDVSKLRDSLKSPSVLQAEVMLNNSDSSPTGLREPISSASPFIAKEKAPTTAE